ncbi:MAG: hypothetical protein U0T77_07110 [Chitinophagales bacterium]
MTKIQKIYFFVTFILISVIVFILFKPVLLAPSQFFFGTGGDSLKNYFTALYYLKNDSGLHFTGMNYPFGEQIVFTDNQPIFSTILKTCFSFGSYNEDTVVAAFNLAMLVSLIISAVFIYLICIHYTVTPWLASISAVIITCLAPQIQRMQGHYALAYVCYFPIIWYLLIQLVDKKRHRLLPIFVLVNFSFGVTHLYYFAISLFFMLACITYMVYEDKTRWKEGVKLLIITILPIVIFQLILSFSDTVTDRHHNPYGFYRYRSYLSSIFLPNLEFERNLVLQFFNYKLEEGEGFGYVGLASVFTLLQYFILKFSKIIKVSPFEKDFSKYVFAGIMCLCLSFCLPFTIGLSGLTKVVPLLSQFRSLGRFNWAFYFVFSISATVILNHFLLLFKEYKFLKYEIIGLILLVWVFEAKQQIKTYADFIVTYGQVVRHEFFDVNFKNELKKVNKSPDDFQAILSFPFFNVGNEEWTNIRDDAGMFTAMRAAYNLQLPIMETALSRTSISQAASLIQLMSNDLIKKTLVQKLNKKPILVIDNNGKEIDMEWRILGKAKKLTDDGRISMYELPVDAFRDSIATTIAWYRENKLNLFRSKYNDSCYSTARSSFYVSDFEYRKKKKDFVLLKINTNKFTPGTTLEFSVWLKVTDAHPGFPPVSCYGYYKDETTFVEEGVGYSTDIYKNFVRARLIVPIKNSEGVLVFHLKGKDIIPGKLLLREINTDVYLEQKNGMLMKNNFYLDDNVRIFDGYK